MNPFSFISAIFDFIGLKGALAITLILLIGGSYLYVDHLQGKVKNLEDSIASQKTVIAEFTKVNKDLSDKLIVQNTQLREADTKFQTAQAFITRADASNALIAKEFSKLNEEFKKKPIPITCDESVLDLHSSINILTEKWNKK